MSVAPTQCPTCYAQRADKQLDQHALRSVDDKVAIYIRSGLARGHIEHLASATYGWRFCAEHAPKHEVPSLLRGVLSGGPDAPMCTEDYARLSEVNPGDFGDQLAERLAELSPEQACALFDLARAGLEVRHG